MDEWLKQNFGLTLVDLFFGPFHDLYTAGLWRDIAPQDSYKSPVNFEFVVQGCLGQVPPVGYNTVFVYPVEGLDVLAQRLAARCNVSYGKKAVHLDMQDKVVYFVDGTKVSYDALISTLPLNQVVKMTELELDARPDPASSVLVLNVGARRGSKTPDAHWLYVSDSRAKFHRVGFYSNVDHSFLPASSREQQDRVSIYVERAYPEGKKPSDVDIELYKKNVVQELQKWEFVNQVEVVDPTWIEVAYTWSWPASEWKRQAIEMLQKHQIYQVGRYAAWVFQGIAASIKDGLVAGSSFS